MRGIDVSSYQGVIDWGRVKAAGVEFAILKIIRKDLSTDKKFEANWKGCEDAGMIVQGVYNYSYATSESASETAARKVVVILDGRGTMVWLDVEDACQKNLGQKLINIILAYKKIIEDAGLPFGVYTGLSFYKTYILPYVEQLVDVPFWIARYPTSNPVTFTTMPIYAYKPVVSNELYGWQYSSKGRINGIAGNVDMNEWYVEIEADAVRPWQESAYTHESFLKDSAEVWNTNDKQGMISRTVTISTNRNRNHAIVTPLERYMKELGFYTGDIEEDSGRKPIFGGGMKKAIKLYQEKVVKAKERYQDGILTAGAATWKTLYK